MTETTPREEQGPCSYRVISALGRRADTPSLPEPSSSRKHSTAQQLSLIDHKPSSRPEARHRHIGVWRLSTNGSHTAGDTLSQGLQLASRQRAPAAVPHNTSPPANDLQQPGQLSFEADR
jgi:hypothetical protein